MAKAITTQKNEKRIELEKKSYSHKRVVQCYMFFFFGLNIDLYNGEKGGKTTLACNSFWLRGTLGGLVGPNRETQQAFP